MPHSEFIILLLPYLAYLIRQYFAGYTLPNLAPILIEDNLFLKKMFHPTPELLN
jgi:hypothetical protein